MKHRYLIALGSNRRHHSFGRPEAVLGAALRVLEAQHIKVKRTSAIMRSAPIGPSRRQYANGAALIKTRLEPGELLDLLKRVEHAFGRRPGGQRWGARVLDLDLVLWSGGACAEPGLTVPHPAFRQRPFVLGPAAAIAPAWRDPLTGHTLRQLDARLKRARLTRASSLPKRD